MERDPHLLPLLRREIRRHVLPQRPVGGVKILVSFAPQGAGCPPITQTVDKGNGKGGGAGLGSAMCIPQSVPLHCTLIPNSHLGGYRPSQSGQHPRDRFQREGSIPSKLPLPGSWPVRTAQQGPNIGAKRGRTWVQSVGQGMPGRWSQRQGACPSPPVPQMFECFGDANRRLAGQQSAKKSGVGKRQRGAMGSDMLSPLKTPPHGVQDQRLRHCHWAQLTLVFHWGWASGTSVHFYVPMPQHTLQGLGSNHNNK